jgi:hypothetical protein
VDEEDIDIDQIPDNAIIKEEEKGTDMKDFEFYLMLIN